LEQTKISAETDTEWHAWTSFRSNRSGSAAARHREEDAATDALDVESTEFARCEVRIIDRGAMAGSAWILLRGIARSDAAVAKRRQGIVRNCLNRVS
jgi:hypothetical protein